MGSGPFHGGVGDEGPRVPATGYHIRNDGKRQPGVPVIVSPSGRQWHTHRKLSCGTPTPPPPRRCQRAYPFLPDNALGDAGVGALAAAVLKPDGALQEFVVGGAPHPLTTPPPNGPGAGSGGPGGDACRARVPTHTVSAPPSAHPTRKARGPPLFTGIGSPGLCLPSASVTAPAGSARGPLQGRRKWRSAVQKPTAHTQGNPPACVFPPHRRGLGSSQPLMATTESNRPSSPVSPPPPLPPRDRPDGGRGPGGGGPPRRHHRPHHPRPQQCVLPSGRPHHATDIPCV